MISQETGLPYACPDMSEVRIHQAQHVHTPTWLGAWIYCAARRDHEAAALIKSLNAPVSDECEGGAHDDCHFSWCLCPHHSVVQFKAEHPQLRSLIEAQGELEEMEYV